MQAAARKMTNASARGSRIGHTKGRAVSMTLAPLIPSALYATPELETQVFILSPRTKTARAK